MEEYTLIEFLDKLKEKKITLALITSSCAIITFILCLLLPKQYETYTTARILPQKSGLILSGGNTGTSQDTSDISNSANNLMIYLQSRAIGTLVVKKYDLASTVMHKMWSSEKNDWKNLEQKPRLTDVSDYIINNGLIKFQHLGGGFIKATCTFHDRTVAVNICNGYIQAAQDYVVSQFQESSTEARRVNKTKINKINTEISTLEAFLNKAQGIQEKANIQRQIEIKADVLADLTVALELNRLASSQNGDIFQIIDKAIAPRGFIYPKPLLFSLFALFISGLFYVAFLLSEEYFKKLRK